MSSAFKACSPIAAQDRLRPFSFPAFQWEQLVSIRRHGRKVAGDHLPAVCALNKDDRDSEFGLALSFWYSAPGHNCGVPEDAHLNVLAANRQAMAGRTFCGNDIRFGNHSPHWSGAEKIIGNNPVQGSAIDLGLCFEPLLG